MQLILESERHIGNNPFDFLATNIIPNGSFVSIGYVNDHEISWGPRTRKNINATNDAKLTEYISKLSEGKFKNALISFQQSPKYQAALASGKTAPFNIEGDVHIIKIGRFTVNWKSSEALAKFYGDRNDATAKIRAKHGFGNEETDYAEDDWRQRYGGTGIRPVSKHKGLQGNPYKPIGNSGFYSHIDEPNKVSIRQIGNPRASKASLWLFIDADGEVSYLDNEMMAWLTYAYKGSKAKDEVKEITQEEQEFLNDLTSIKDYDKQEMTMLLDNILYLTGTTVDANKNKEPFTWLNDEKISELYPYINRKELDSIIRKCVKVSNKETQEMNESFKVETSKKSQKDLYENVMTKIAPKIKAVLEEYGLETMEIEDEIIPENDVQAHKEEVNACVKDCIMDIVEMGGTYLSWGDAKPENKNVNSRTVAEEVARKFQDKGYFVYYELVNGIEDGIRIQKRPQLLDEETQKEFV